MPKTVTFDPVCSRTSADVVVVPQIATNRTELKEAVCRIVAGDQVVVPEVAQ